MTFYKIREEKGGKILRKLYFQKLERKWKILIYNWLFLNKNWIYYDLLKINDKKCWNKDLGLNHEIDLPNDIQIKKFTYE